MAKRETRPAGRPGKSAEIAGFLLIVLAAGLALALLYYHVSDPSPNTKSYPPTEPTNPLGRFGANVADVFVQFGGLAGWVIPVLILILGILVYQRRRLRITPEQVFGYPLMIVAIAILLALLFKDQKAGGIVGWVVADQLRYLLGEVGSLLAAFALLVISLILAVNLTFVGHGRRLIGLLASLFGSLGGWWTSWRQARDRRRRRREKEQAARREKPGPAPVIHRASSKPAVTVKPEAKARTVSGEAVRSTRLDEDPASTPPPPPHGKEAVTIHKKEETVAAQQISFGNLTSNYETPPLDLFQAQPEPDKALDQEALLAQSVALESKLETFGVTGRVRDIHPGPVITMFEYEPAPGIKLSRIANLEDDLAMALQAEKIRIIAPIPGKGAVGIEVPSLRREVVFLREILESKEFNDSKSPLTVAFGKTSRGKPLVEKLERMPHLLVAGTTGSGKSVFINCLIMSLIYKSTPEQVRLLMVDPKQLELSMYTDTPHMLHPVVTEPKKAALLLRWAVAEMEDRYRRMADLHVRNINNYNEKVEKILAKKPRKATLTGNGDQLETLPYIVIIIDELSDLMMVAAKEVEESIARLAQMARAAGIHLLVATQRPSTDVITGVIKANFPSRISFQVRARVDSRIILDEGGANNLLGMGDALFLPPGTGQITRFHAPFVSDEEVQEVVHFLKHKHQPPQSVEIRTSSGGDLHNTDEADLDLSGDREMENELFDKAVEIVARDRKASVSYIQRKLKIGYNRAAAIIERMEQEGMIAPSDGTSRPRDIFLPERDYDE